VRKVLLILFAALLVTTGIVYARVNEPRQLVLYRDQPSCDDARALALDASWKTPFKSGIVVWICD
jgi:hypothetical protein